MDCFCRVATILDGPDHEGGTPHNVSRSKDARQAGHHGRKIDAHSAPAIYGERLVVEEAWQVFGIEPQGLDHQISVHVKVRAINLFRCLTPAGIGQAEPHPRGAYLRHLTLHIMNGLRRREPFEFDAFFLGIQHLPLGSGHILPVAAVKAGNRLGALTHGGTYAIHGRITATDNHDALAAGIHAAVFIARHSIAQTDPVGRGKIFQSGQYIPCARSRQGQVPGLVNARRQQHRLVLCPQVHERNIAAHITVEDKLDTALCQIVGTPLHHVLFQLEAGNAVDEKSAHPIITIIDGDLIALAAELFSGGQPSGTRAHNAHAFGAFPRRLDRFDPTLFPGRFGNVSLDLSNGHRPVTGLLDHTGPFAQAILRTNPTADLGHVISGGGNRIGFFQSPLGGEHQPVGNIVPEGTMLLAERHTALGAPRGLLGGLLRDVILVNLVKILTPLFRRALFGAALIDRHEFKHAVIHACRS